MREANQIGRSKDIRFDNELPEQGLFVMADYDRLVQVFRNLIENAFKYGPPGSVVRVHHSIEGGEVVFGVSDQGPGVPRSEQARIFERFYRIDKNRRKAGTSSGLGLAIVRHIVEKHGGRVWLESPALDDDVGATFYFSLRLAQPHARQERSRELNA